MPRVPVAARTPPPLRRAEPGIQVVQHRRHEGIHLTYGDAAPLNPVLQLGELEIDILHRQVRDGSSELHLTGLEQGLLHLLAANRDRVVTRDEILDALWGVGYTAESNVVDRHVPDLRANLLGPAAPSRAISRPDLRTPRCRPRSAAPIHPARLASRAPRAASAGRSTPGA
jgi:DNA-binding response OmpR family regulator